MPTDVHQFDYSSGERPALKPQSPLQPLSQPQPLVQAQTLRLPHTTRSRVWWTKARVVAGLKLFYRDFGVAPTSTAAYQVHQQFTGVMRDGRVSYKGYESKYPSSYAVLKHFKTYRAAWRAAGIETNRHWEEWTAEEDWFIRESVGVFARAEVARYINRSPAAIKRRLYDLRRADGADTRACARWGWTPNRIESLTGISMSIVGRYIAHGRIPVFRGNKCCYLDPGDLPLIAEYDWSQTPTQIPEALYSGVMKSLVTRLCGVIERRESPARSSIYRYETPSVFQGRVKRHPPAPPPPHPPPAAIRVGTMVRVVPNSGGDDDDGGASDFGKTANQLKNAAGRTGIVKAVYWSPQKRKASPGRAARSACWMAKVEFRKTNRHARDTPRVSYSVAIAALEVTEDEGGNAPADHRRVSEETKQVTDHRPSPA